MTPGKSNVVKAAQLWWSEHNRLEILQEEWAKGTTTQQIANIINEKTPVNGKICTKNMVIGIARRRDLSLRTIAKERPKPLRHHINPKKCMWPIGGGDEFHFCGEDLDPKGGPYCRNHFNISVQKEFRRELTEGEQNVMKRSLIRSTKLIG